MKNNGVKNEYCFIEKINNNKFNELPFLLQELILFLFPQVKPCSIIKCYKNIEYEKADVVIQLGDTKKYISIKKGHNNSIHCESIKKFTNYLKQLNISKRTINEILRYQYADGTLDGTGNYRKSIVEYKKDNEKSISLINKELNNPKIIQKIINRFIIQGTQWHLHKIDLLIYGTPNDFFFITPNEIYTYIMNKINTESSAIHFSCLTFQPLSRVLNYDKKFEYMRHWIQIKWYNLEDNIIELMNDRYKYLNN